MLSPRRTVQKTLTILTKSMKLLKFGGSSISTPDRVKAVIEIVDASQKEQPIAVVFSAFGGITDQLIKLSHQSAEDKNDYTTELESLEDRIFTFAKTLIRAKNQSTVFAHLKSTLNELEDVLHGVNLTRELTPRTLDFIMSFGERLSAYLITEAMKDKNIPAEFVDTRKLVRTDETFGAARVDFDQTNTNIREHFQGKDTLQMLTGFIGTTAKNETITLGRSGSDYTASIFGAALDADEVEIWTDVNGIMTADPRIVPDAFSLSHVTYEEAMEMSHFGARVIHPSSMQPAFEKNIPIRIRNTFDPEFPGTLISNERSQTEHRISGVSSIKDIALLRVQGSGMLGVTGISARLFSALARAEINIILITQASSEHTICFAVQPADAERAKRVIEDEFSLEMQVNQIDEVIVEKDLSIVAAVGENMRHTPGIAGRLFQILGQNNVNVVAIAQGSSELNISAVVAKDDEATAINATHFTFFDGQKETIDVVLIGTGLVGSTLIRQIGDYQEASAGKNKRIRLAGLMNSRKMVFSKDGITPGEGESVLESTGDSASVSDMLEQAKRSKSNCIFVDCTASDAIADKYSEILSAGFPLVAANKKAASGAYESYAQLQHLSKENHTPFLYETNAGAGLPVIQTIRQLYESGDTIHNIEGILSGTLSYIFNTYDGTVSFSELVADAQEKGYTEPDPRDDLDGMDVARKLLILAREAGYQLEPEDISVNKFLPESCFEATSTDKFFTKLKDADSDMKNRYDGAKEAGKVLRFIASLENGEATVSLQAVDANHPFYHVAGSDNIVAITTARYSERPLVIQGAGAGAKVTAVGVLSDILRASKLKSKN